MLRSSDSKPERALSVLRNCESLMEKEVAFPAPVSSPLQSPPSTPGLYSAGPTRDFCLDAVLISLNRMCDGKSWYTSTKELQLASLEFCIACRSYRAIHLTVGAQIPRRLLAAVDAPSPHPHRLCWTRVPRLRVRRVTWNMRTAAMLRTPIFAISEVDCLEFGFAFKGSLEAVAWPRRLKAIKFGHCCWFNMPINLVEWPASLQRLAFGKAFNQPIERANFPASLQELAFGENFMHPIKDVPWPPSLQRLSFGVFFDQPIEEVVWPTSLKQLSIDALGWFNMPIQRAAFPASLEQLALGGSFNQPIEGVVWPDSLQKLDFGPYFNRPIDNVRWPASLQELTIGRWDDLGDTSMLMFSNFNQRIDGCVWPASMRRLTLGGAFRQSLQGLGTWMPNLETLGLFDRLSDDSLLRGIEWPKSLRHLTVFRESSLDGVVIPSTVHVYRRDGIAC
ncbi:unnamed protein product [Ectocarpus sp. 4 AP-2014]